MAGRLPDLGADEQRLVIASLGLTAVMDDPSDRHSRFTVTSREGAAAILPQLSGTYSDDGRPWPCGA